MRFTQIWRQMPADAAFDAGRLQKVRLLGGEPLVTRLVELFLEHAPAGIARLRRSSEQGVLDDVMRAAHSLRSTAANVGAVRLAGLAADIESAAERASRGEVEALLPQAEAALASARQHFSRLLREDR